MENKGNSSVQPWKRPRTAPRKNLTSNCLFCNEDHTKGNSMTKNVEMREKVQISSKTNDSNKKRKKENFLSREVTRRPSTVSAVCGSKTGSGEKGRSPVISTSKSFSVQSKSNWFDRKSADGCRSTSTYSGTNKQNQGKNTAKTPGKHQIDCSLFLRVIHEQERIIEVLCLAKEELRGKMVEKKSRGADKNVSAESLPSEPPNSIKLEDSHRGALEEIFQAWVNLFYFIINLKINLIRVVNFAGTTEPFKLNTEIEKEIVEQATECVKFFSRLKAKCIVNSVEDLYFPDERNMKIKEYEERVWSPFLFEMDFIQKKGKEFVELMKRTPVKQ